MPDKKNESKKTYRVTIHGMTIEQLGEDGFTRVDHHTEPMTWTGSYKMVVAIQGTVFAMLDALKKLGQDRAADG